METNFLQTHLKASPDERKHLRSVILPEHPGARTRPQGWLRSLSKCFPEGGLATCSHKTQPGHLLPLEGKRTTSGPFWTPQRSAHLQMSPTPLAPSHSHLQAWLRNKLRRTKATAGKTGSSLRRRRHSYAPGAAACPGAEHLDTQQIRKVAEQAFSWRHRRWSPLLQFPAKSPPRKHFLVRDHNLY